ncbi:hypothetical protein TraAM80_06822 [Trypanosoma rangeli]|uniref:Uncharacterized protein n=1 Tax=Trypanosoma rangeli TaxID=5698 RepID=A0A3R7K8H1_TRYRA|nr:uncharacterized protein TraAM80_06822 [Trypanosoma rangeli]RNF01699.1 hypothetical protein TraAM80_06822 [Trypanosoma rangeli]|eukprot:RNF01699.1 hypothetical protein TraAM80_06822 [Trypanosoma rangeli]
MPGREVPPRTGSAKGRCKPAGSPYGAASASTRQKMVIARAAQPKKEERRPLQQSVAITPACEMCLSLLHYSQKVRNALEAVLENARVVFLDDTLHHQMNDERWVRVLRAIGAEKSTYYTRAVVLNRAPFKSGHE